MYNNEIDVAGKYSYFEIETGNMYLFILIPKYHI